MRRVREVSAAACLGSARPNQPRVEETPVADGQMRLSTRLLNHLLLCLLPVIAVEGFTQWTLRARRESELNPNFSVRPNGADHQWRRVPSRELSVGPGS